MVVTGISVALLVLVLLVLCLVLRRAWQQGGKWRKPVAATRSSRQLYCSARACVLLSTTMLAVAADNFVALRVLELSVLCFLLLLLLHADQIIPDISIARASVLLSITSDTMDNRESKQFYYPAKSCIYFALALYRWSCLCVCVLSSTWCRMASHNCRQLYRPA